MAESKYGKYIVYKPKDNIVKPPWSPQGKIPGRVAYLDNDVIDGAFYMECVFFGSDMNDMYDLGGEAELWLGDEKHIINKSCLVFIPKGLQHCPLLFHRIDKPIFHFSVGPGKMYF
jgi:hypothetical protein